MLCECTRSGAFARRAIPRERPGHLPAYSAHGAIDRGAPPLVARARLGGEALPDRLEGAGQVGRDVWPLNVWKGRAPHLQQQLAIAPGGQVGDVGARRDVLEPD